MMSEGKNPRGFALLDPEKRRQLAAKGGRSVRPENRTFARDPEIAAVAGRRGGLSTQWNRDATRKGNLPLVSNAGDAAALDARRIKRRCEAVRPDQPDLALQEARSMVERVARNQHLGRRTCRICGCWEYSACEGGCWWVEEDLCSSCEAA